MHVPANSFHILTPRRSVPFIVMWSDRQIDTFFPLGDDWDGPAGESLSAVSSSGSDFYSYSIRADGVSVTQYSSFSNILRFML